MDVHEEILENRGQLKLLEAKFDVLLAMLIQEGVIEKDEFDEAFTLHLKHSRKD